MISDTPSFLRRHFRIVNAVMFQGGWFLAALGPTWGLPWLGPLVAVVFIAFHLRYVSAQPRTELLTVLAVLPLGLIFDSVLSASGWVDYAGGWLSPLAPLWILAMWALYATTLHNALGFILNLKPLPRYAMAVAGGGFSGTTSYIAGTRLGAISFPQPFWPTVALLVVMWAVAVPLTVLIAGWLRGRDSDTAVRAPGG